MYSSISYRPIYLLLNLLSICIVDISVIRKQVHGLEMCTINDGKLIKQYVVKHFMANKKNNNNKMPI